MCLLDSLGLFTIYQRNTLLSFRFKDLQISLQKDPRGGPLTCLVNCPTR